MRSDKSGGLHPGNSSRCCGAVDAVLVLLLKSVLITITHASYSAPVMSRRCSAQADMSGA